MESTVNSRILLLKKELGLTDIQFCGRANISTFTLNKVRNNEETTQKITNAILLAFNVNKDWLLNGKGKMFLDAPKFDFKTGSEPWKDEAYSVLKNENSRLAKELERLWQMVQHLSGGAKPNFLKAVNLTDFHKKKVLIAQA